MFNKAYPNYLYTKDGTRIFYTTNFNPENSSGSKDLLVFNYGLVCSNHHWSKQLPLFDELGHHILIHDYRGHFNSSSDEGLATCTFKQFAEDIKQLTDSIPHKNLILLGHSMGVNVSLEFAKEYPDSVHGMILISGTVFPPHDVMFDSNLMDIIIPYVELLEKKAPKIFKGIWKNSSYLPLVQKLIQLGGFNPKKVPIQFIQIYLQKIGQLSPELFFKLFKEMGEHDILAHLEKIKTPTLIMGGDHDKIIPNYIQDVIHDKLVNSELYIIKDGSHVPQVDFPQTVNERILFFLKKQNLGN